jgi:hypothetical protein
MAPIPGEAEEEADLEYGSDEGENAINTGHPPRVF